MPSTTPFHPQPLKAVLEAQGRRQSWIATQTGRSRHHVWEVVNGLRRPSPTFKADVAAVLGLPEDVLFRADWLQSEAS